jgi:hypothetical protein
MANFILANAKPDFNKQLVYDFKDTSVKPNSTGTYFSTSLPDPGNASLIYTNKTNTTYTTSKLYIYRLLHSNITDITDDNSTIVGELVVELKPSTGSTKAYMCFLLESTPSGISQVKTPIDDLLDPANAGKSIKVNVNSFMSSMDACITYTETTNKNTVFIFKQPLFITSTSYNTITSSGSTGSGYDSSTDLFNVGAPTAYSTIPSTNIKMSGKNEILIECSPTTVVDSFQTWTSSTTTASSEKMIEGMDSKPSINLVSSLSDAAKKDQIVDFSKMAAFACIIITNIIVCYSIIPPLYKFFVIDKVARLSNTVLTRIRSVDYFLGFFFILLVFVLYVLAANVHFMFIYVGFFVFAFYLLSYALLYIKKGETGFMKVRKESGMVEFKYDEPTDTDPDPNSKYTDWDDVTSFFGSVIPFVIFQAGVYIIGAWIALLLVVGILWLTYQIPDEIAKNILIVVGAVVIPILAPIIKLIEVAPAPK